ncbi:MAG: hypothetical protein ACE5GL_02490 [Calditrichia bacterium]
MAKVKKKAPVEKYHFPLGKTNYTILIIAMVTLIVGYIFMGIPDNPDDFLTRTLSPIILVIGYLILIPVGLFYRDKRYRKGNK